ncbi:MAG: MGMT family protein, partial [Bullifex sp.]|nr:MGMT family protein [Bullifex sp.]
YGEVARLIGNPKASRAVGGALHINPCFIIIPCHRVVSSSSLGGFGFGPEVKEKLLSLEKAQEESSL